MSVPSKRTVPLVGSCSRTSSRPRVDLPQPDSPTMPSVSPRRTSSETPSTACTCSRAPRRDERRAHREVLDEVDRLEQHGRSGCVMRSRGPARRPATPAAAPAEPRGRDGTRPGGPGRPARAAPAASRRARSGAGSGARTGSPRREREERGRRARDRGEPARRAAGRRAGSSRAAPRCTDAAVSRKTADFGPSSTTLPAYITTIRSARSATTPMSWVMRRIEEPYSRWRRFISSRICAWIVTSSAVVGSSAIRSDGLHESAIAIITRWRIPPENWCG